MTQNVYYLSLDREPLVCGRGFTRIKLPSVLKYYENPNASAAKKKKRQTTATHIT